MTATMTMELIEKLGEFKNRFSNWSGNENLATYPFVENVYAPFTPVKRALPMTNLALITSAGAYIDGTEPFDTTARDGDLSFREIPIEVEAEDLRYAARGYDAKFVQEDRNAQIPVDRLLEYEANGWWTMNGFMPNAARVAEELAPKLAERVNRYECQAVLLVPASRLCVQTLGIVARAIEQTGVPTMLIAPERQVADKIRPPRTAFYKGEFGCVVGKPNWKEYQLRVLDEAIRWIETLDQPVVKKLAVELETEVENERGER
jgi:D-proline reductase (dithiol) PrdB